MREWSPEFKANLERALENLFEFSPESIKRIAPFRRTLEEQEREYLRLLLESKFGQLSSEQVAKLETVHDLEELTRLYKRALQAQTLAEVGL